MPAETHAQRILFLARQKGLLRSSDLAAIGAPRVVLTRLSATGLLEKVGHGLYRLPDAPGSEHESLATVTARARRRLLLVLLRGLEVF